MPVQRLMANAGKALAEAARAMSEGPIVVLCGKGNNGGDGYAAAGVLRRWGVPTRVVSVEAPAKGSTAAAYRDLLDDVQPWGKDRRAWADAELVIDCMLGSGIQGRPRPPYDQAIRWANKRRVLACDVPSGWQTGLAVHPERTVTFHAKTEGMGRACGDVVVADIGIPEAASHVGLGDLDAGYVRPGDEGHKGQHGRVLVVGGGPFTGAPHYAGMGAIRTGADLVHVATTNRAARLIGSWGPELIVHGVTDSEHLGPDCVDAVVDLAKRADALVIGPGIGDHADSLDFVRALLDATDQSAVIDAEALQALKGTKHGDRIVATPHGGEFQKMAGRRKPQTWAKQTSTVLLRKGVPDVITDGACTRECHRGHPTMTVGGTGDVLAGAVGALLAKGADRFDAACAGAYLVGCAGEVAASLRSFGATATDVHEAIPAVLLRLP